MIDRLLQLTSRTFALSIPLLPERVRDEITVAYLLFRVADTLEDEPAWPARQRADALAAFADLLASSSTGRSSDVATPGPVTDDAYAELIDHYAAVSEALATFSPEAQAIIVEHLQRTIDGMRTFLLSERGVASLEEVREYCYYVAGIVGELCTCLFVLHSPSVAPRSEELVALAPSFGEALQLINILRDEDDDEADGRRYIPADQERGELMAIAAHDLDRATEYVAILEQAGAAPGIVGFNALNLLLGYATLGLVHEIGPGAKLSRADVRRTLDQVTAAVESGTPLVPLLREASGLISDIPRGDVPDPLEVTIRHARPGLGSHVRAATVAGPRDSRRGEYA